MTGSSELLSEHSPPTQPALSKQPGEPSHLATRPEPLIFIPYTDIKPGDLSDLLRLLVRQRTVWRGNNYHAV